MKSLWLAFAAACGFLVPASNAEGQLETRAQVCNNSPALCEKKYNNITHLGAHDSPFVRNASNGYTPFGDQFYDSLTQLDAGVRLLTAQVHKNNTSWDLCHTACFFEDAGTLTNWLNGIKGWLDAHPSDVVTILLVNSDNADAATLDQQFKASDITRYGYVPSSTSKPTSDWPTLAQMISTNKRLVTFIANLPSASNTVAPYLLDEFTFVFENNYDVDHPTDFSCEVNRPSTVSNVGISTVLGQGYLPLMNHFLYDNTGGIESPSVENTQNTNAASGSVGNLGQAADNCTSFYGGRPPTFVLVDFFNIGPAVTTIDRLNNVQNNVQGRISLPNTLLGTTASVLPSLAPLTSSVTSTAMDQNINSNTLSGVSSVFSTTQEQTSRQTVAAPATSASQTGAAGFRVDSDSTVLSLAATLLLIVAL